MYNLKDAQFVVGSGGVNARSPPGIRRGFIVCLFIYVGQPRPFFKGEPQLWICDAFVFRRWISRIKQPRPSALSSIFDEKITGIHVLIFFALFIYLWNMSRAKIAWPKESLIPLPWAVVCCGSKYLIHFFWDVLYFVFNIQKETVCFWYF